MKKIQLCWMMLGVIFMPLACDTLEEDVAPTTDLSVSSADISEASSSYRSTGGEVLINLLQGIEASQAVRIALEKAPTQGEATLLDSGYLRYVPYPDYSAGTDSIVVALSSGQSSRKDTIRVVLSMPGDSTLVDPIPSDSICNGLIVRDDSYLLTDSVAQFNQNRYYLDVLTNDQLCTLAYDLTLPIENPNLTVEDGKIVYTSSDQQNISFAYTVCLQNDTCQSGQVNVEFYSCQPYALDDSVFFYQDPFVGADTLTIDVQANDQVCDDTPINIYQAPARGRAWVEDNKIKYEYIIEPNESYGTWLKYEYGNGPVADSTNRALVSIEIRTK